MPIPTTDRRRLEPSTSRTWGTYGMEFTDEFDEHKCRNVLVRFCAHIPRNYQYRDGVRLIFLVLRDHLGDEHLGRAGGVLYEMIEVDCQHTDDQGAAFQRWKFDHMNRHADLELPHVPHLTTVTSTIMPTSTLIEWRRSHPERYSTRLSDYASRPLHDHGCVRTRKNWSIDYTMYVSSREDGTRPFRTIKAKAYHEIVWGSPDFGGKGRLVEEKSIDSLDRCSGSNLEHQGLRKSESQLSLGDYSDSSSSRSFRSLVRNASPWKEATSDARQERWLSPSLSSESWLHRVEHNPELAANLGKIPNAVFARKFRIFESSALPPTIRELPIAEDKAINMAAHRSAKDLRCSWKFKGPFTPQLWFDSGLDFKWKKA